MTGWIDVLYRHMDRARGCLGLAVTVCGVPLAIAEHRPGAAMLFASAAGVLTFEYLGAIGAWMPSRRTIVWLLGVCGSLFLIGIVVLLTWELQSPAIDVGVSVVWAVGIMAGLAYLTWLVQSHRALIAALVVHAEPEVNLDDETAWPRTPGRGQIDVLRQVGETRRHAARKHMRPSQLQGDRR